MPIVSAPRWRAGKAFRLAVGSPVCSAAEGTPTAPCCVLLYKQEENRRLQLLYNKVSDQGRQLAEGSVTTTYLTNLVEMFIHTKYFTYCSINKCLCKGFAPFSITDWSVCAQNIHVLHVHLLENKMKAPSLGRGVCAHNVLHFIRVGILKTEAACTKPHPLPVWCPEPVHDWHHLPFHF